MRLKKIHLENVRSYENETVDFHPGSTLLCGDVGSGKTSILLAIEFAFFGLQPGQRGHALLRNGENEGKVIMECEVDGKEVRIERTLKRGKTVSQGYCAITINGEKNEMSVSELKSKVLELMNYPREFAKKQNIMYKFTVYTPQEEMKEIILQDAETRINTLRHIFGIDKYKRINDNTSLLASKLREEKRIKEALTEDLEGERSLFLSKEKELEEKNKLLLLAKEALTLRISKRKACEGEKEDLVKKVEEKNKFKQEVEKTNIVVSSKESTLIDNTKLMSVLRTQLQSLQSNNLNEEVLLEKEREVLVLRNERDVLNNKLITLGKTMYSLEIKNKENQKILETLKELQTCPTCLQEVEPIYKSHVKNNLDNNSSKNNQSLSAFQEEKESHEKDLEILKDKIKIADDRIQEIKMFLLRKEQMKEKEERIRDLENVNLSLEKDIALLKSHNESLKSFISDFLKFERMLLTKNEELNEAFRK